MISDKIDSNAADEKSSCSACSHLFLLNDY